MSWIIGFAFGAVLGVFGTLATFDWATELGLSTKYAPLLKYGSVGAVVVAAIGAAIRAVKALVELVQRFTLASVFSGFRVFGVVSRLRKDLDEIIRSSRHHLSETRRVAGHLRGCSSLDVAIHAFGVATTQISAATKKHQEIPKRIRQAEEEITELQKSVVWDHGVMLGRKEMDISLGAPDSTFLCFVAIRNGRDVGMRGSTKWIRLPDTGNDIYLVIRQPDTVLAMGELAHDSGPPKSGKSPGPGTGKSNDP